MTLKQLEKKLSNPTAGKVDRIRMIQQAKSEWLFEFISWYANKYEMKFTDEFKSGLIKMFLNTPEP